MNSPKQLLAGRRVLVADDEPFNLSIVVRMMRELGSTQITAASGGGEAMLALGEGAIPVDFAILDFNMPQMNGLEILKLVRIGESGMPRHLPILMLTGSSDFSLVGAAMALDVDAFIIKPVSQAAMAARLEKILKMDHDCKPVADYQKVDVDEVSRRLIKNQPVGLVRTKAQAKKPVPQGVPVKLDLVQAGAILSEDIRSPSGELLLGRATVLSDRLIRRLFELQSMLKLEYVYIFPQTEKKAD